MQPPYSGQNKNTGGMGVWIAAVVLLLTPLWPVGLVMFLWKLLGGSRRAAGTETSAREGGKAKSVGTDAYTEPVGWETSRQGKPVNLNWGRGLTVGGGVLAVLGALILAWALPALLGEAPEIIPLLCRLSPGIGLLAAGCAMALAGIGRTRRARRWCRYLALVGHKERVSLAALAQAMGVSAGRARRDLQEMLERGIFAAGYLDMARGQLVLGGEWTEEPAQPEEADRPDDGGESVDVTDPQAVLAEIARINRAVTNPQVSRKIDRIGEITGRIFAYQRQNPEEKGRLRSFLGYYLPTTLKILDVYAQMESQGADGENIRAAKARVEGMLDKVAQGFEMQLELLYQSDAMDVAADVEVLEQMLEKDGLSGGRQSGAPGH